MNDSQQLPSKDVWVGWISSMVEAYNMAIYSFTAPLLAKQLFQNATLWTSLFFSYSLVFLGTCLLYPLGALYYGYLGDKKGRQQTCIYSTLGLGIATGFMGFAPFNLLGDYEWVYFLVLIGAQHFFSGGEYHGSIVFSLEHAQPKRSGMMSAISCLFAVFGIAAANGLATLSFFMENLNWVRFCFLIGGVGGLISYFLKYHCRETPVFTAIAQQARDEMKLVAFIKVEWKKIIAVVSILAFFTISYYFIFVFLPLVNIEQNGSYTFDTFKSLLVYGLFLVFAGWLADRFNIQRVIMWGLGSFIVLILPLCYFFKNLFVIQLILTFCACLVIGPIHSWMLQQFIVQRRCRGIFISAAVATSIFGGSTVPIYLMIFEKSHSLVACGSYAMAIATWAFVSLICLKKKATT